MAKTHPLFHKFKSVVGYSIAIVVIVIALAVSGLRLLLTTANVYQHEVEQLASSLLEQPVKIGRMDAKLSGLIPTLIFHNVQLVSEQTKKTLFSLTRIDVGLSVNDLLWKQKLTPSQITVRGMNLHVTRTVQGKLKIKGVNLEAISNVADSDSNSLLEHWLLQQSEIGLEDSTLTWKDEQNAGLTWFFNDVNFLLKNTQERHQLSLSGKLPNVLGDKIKVAFDLVGDVSSPETWDIKIFIESKGVNIIPLQQYIKYPGLDLINGVADLKLWLDWKKQNVKQLSGDIKLHNFSYRLNKKTSVELKYVAGVFDSLRDENNMWNVSVDKFNYTNNREVLSESKFSLAFDYKDKLLDTFHIKANHLKLGVLSKIITDNHLTTRANEKKIKELNVNGDIRNFYVAWKNNELLKLNTDFTGLGVNSWKNIPKLKSLSGNVRYEQKEGLISLSSEKSTVGFSRIFRGDFKLDKLNADINFYNTKQGLYFNIYNLRTKSKEAKTVSKAKLWLPKNDASPYLDLQTYISDGDVSKVSRYLPVSIMETSLIKWLDKSFISGKVNKSTIVFNGEFSKFPFYNNEGAFHVTADTSEFVMNYQDGWPKIKNANMLADFTGQSMKLHLLTGKVEGNSIHDSYAEIASFSNADLHLDLSANGSADNTMKYLVNSPIMPSAKSTVNSMRFSGDVDAKIKINIPLGDAVSKKKSLSYSGSAKLHDVSVFMLGNKLDITGTKGKLFFTEKELSSDKLLGYISGKPATFSLTSSKTKGINISAKGKMEPGIILERFEIPGAKKISGVTTFSANINFPEAKNKHPNLTLKSNLVGVRSDLPEFFYKKKNTSQKITFTTIFADRNKLQFGIDFEKKASAILELDQSSDITYLKKGAISASSNKAVLPRKNILYVDGKIGEVTPSTWFKALELDKSKKKQTFFVNPIVLNLDSLKILINDDDEDESNLASNPKHLPAFEGIIKKFYFDKIFIGRLDFKSSKKKYGLHLDELIVSSKNMKLVSHGAWRYSRGKHKTNMDITLSSHDFGGMLTDLGYAAVIEKGTAKAICKLKWDAAATQFSYDKLNGTIQLNLKNGNIIEADAGAGRLLGLFSLSALPRKLFGDFKDTFKSGFNFDSADGEILLEDGDAYTDDFSITSTVADVTVSGRTGIADRDYENLIEVVPEIGGGLAGMTALLVNLPAGIGVWLLDKVTGKQFNKVSTRRYEVSGSWDKPLIEQIKDEE